MVEESVTEADATNALQAAVGMDHPLSSVDDCVVAYLANALADSAAAEDEVVGIVSSFLWHLELTGRAVDNVWTQHRRRVSPAKTSRPHIIYTNSFPAVVSRVPRTYPVRRQIM